MKYIAKKDTWFNEGTKARLIDDYRPDMDAGLFEGMRTCDSASEGRPISEKYLDEEVCDFDEFEITE